MGEHAAPPQPGRQDPATEQSPNVEKVSTDEARVPFTQSESDKRHNHELAERPGNEKYVAKEICGTFGSVAVQPRGLPGGFSFACSSAAWFVAVCALLLSQRRCTRVFRLSVEFFLTLSFTRFCSSSLCPSPPSADFFLGGQCLKAFQGFAVLRPHDQRSRLRGEVALSASSLFSFVVFSVSPGLWGCVRVVTGGRAAVSLTYWVAAGEGRGRDSAACISGTRRVLASPAPESQTPARTDGLPERSSEPETGAPERTESSRMRASAPRLHRPAEGSSPLRRREALLESRWGWRRRGADGGKERPPGPRQRPLNLERRLQRPNEGNNVGNSSKSAAFGGDGSMAALALTILCISKIT